MVLASAIEPLRAACAFSGRRLFEWRVASLDGQSVRSSSGLRFEVDAPLGQVGRMEALIVVAGYGVREVAELAATIVAVRGAARRADMIIGLDMGAWVLAAAGLLRGHRATVHWQEIDAFAEKFLEVNVVTESHVIDATRQSAGSAASTMDLVLELIRHLAGDALAYDVRSLFIYDDADLHRAQSGALSPRLGRAVRRMVDTLSEPEPLRDIAAHAAVSERTLDRLFRRELGVSTGEYYRSLRLQHAQTLVIETDIPAQDIAVRTGFTSVSTLSRAFHAYFGQTLRGMRKHQRP